MKNSTKKASAKKPAPAAADNWLLPDLCTISTYAAKKGVQRQSVFYHIHSSKKIKPVFIGMGRDLYIDWNQYHDFDFREPNQKHHD